MDEGRAEPTQEFLVERPFKDYDDQEILEKLNYWREALDATGKKVYEAFRLEAIERGLVKNGFRWNVRCKWCGQSKRTMFTYGYTPGYFCDRKCWESFVGVEEDSHIEFMGSESRNDY